MASGCVWHGHKDVRDVEYGEVHELELDKVHHKPVKRAVDEVAHRTRKHERERDTGQPVELPPVAQQDIEQHKRHEPGEHGQQHRVLAEHAKGRARVFDIGIVEHARQNGHRPAV